MTTLALVSSEQVRAWSRSTLSWSLAAVLIVPLGVAVTLYALATTSIGALPGDSWGAGLASGAGVGVAQWILACTTLAAMATVSTGTAVYGAQSLAGPRERGTMDTIRMTSTDADVVNAAFFSVWLRGAWYSACTAPVVAIPVLLGGVSLAALCGAVLAIFVVATVAGSIGVAASAGSTRSPAAIASAIGVTLALCWLPLAIGGIWWARTWLTKTPDAPAVLLSKGTWANVASMSPASLGVWTPLVSHGVATVGAKIGVALSVSVATVLLCRWRAFRSMRRL